MSRNCDGTQSRRSRKLTPTTLPRPFSRTCWKKPMAPAALMALGDLQEAKAIDKVREGLSSRDPEVVAASARAAGKLLALSTVKAEDVRGQLAALLTDGDAALEARTEAFGALVELAD